MILILSSRNMRRQLLLSPITIFLLPALVFFTNNADQKILAHSVSISIILIAISWLSKCAKLNADWLKLCRKESLNFNLKMNKQESWKSHHWMQKFCFEIQNVQPNGQAQDRWIVSDYKNGWLEGRECSQQIKVAGTRMCIHTVSPGRVNKGQHKYIEEETNSRRSHLVNKNTQKACWLLTFRLFHIGKVEKSEYPYVKRIIFFVLEYCASI